MGLLSPSDVLQRLALSKPHERRKKQHTKEDSNTTSSSNSSFKGGSGLPQDVYMDEDMHRFEWGLAEIVCGCMGRVK